MKLSLLISALIVGILMVILLKRWTSETLEPPAASNVEGRTRFMSACTATASAMPRPEAYCACLWGKGVTSPEQTLTSPGGQRAASECASSGRGAPSSPAPAE